MGYCAESLEDCAANANICWLFGSRHNEKNEKCGLYREDGQDIEANEAEAKKQ